MPRGKEPDDHKGRTYGPWLALRRGPVPEPSVPGQGVPWLCSCNDCGHEQWIIPGQFKYTRNRLRCVGCAEIRRDEREAAAATRKARNTALPVGKSAPAAGGKQEIPPYAWTLMRLAAEARGDAWNIDPGAALRAYENQEGRCAITRTPLRLANGPRLQRTAGMARIDEELPYQEGNVHWIHRDVRRFIMIFGRQKAFELVRGMASNTPLASEMAAENDNDESGAAVA